MKSFNKLVLLFFLSSVNCTFGGDKEGESSNMGNFFKNSVVVSPSLRLDPVNLNDSERIFDLVNANRSYLRQWLSWVDGINQRSDVDKFIENSRREMQKKKSMTYSMRFCGLICGVMAVHTINWNSRETSLGYWIDQNHQGKGLVTKACTSLISSCFDDISLEKISISCISSNYKSRNIPHRLGFNLDGIAQGYQLLYGKYYDHHVYSITSKRWKALPH